MKERKERIAQQDAKRQSEVGVILIHVPKRIQFDSLYGNSSKITTSKNSCHFLWLSSDLFSGGSKKRIFVKRHAIYVKRNTEARSCNHCCSGKATCIAYFECVFVALFIQHAIRMPHVILSSVVCPSVQFLFTLPHKRKIFQNNILNIKYIFCLLYNFV